MSHLEKCSGCPICELIKAKAEVKNVLVLFEEEKDNIRVLNKSVSYEIGIQCIILALAIKGRNLEVGAGYINDKDDFTLSIERLTKDIFAVSFSV